MSRNRAIETLLRVQLASLALACSTEPVERTYPTASELYDSKRCAQCHPKHYDEWAASMHAYAAEDPVFIAMNRRGQEETDGELGSFCVNCHAPLAVRTGATTDGLNLAEVPESLRGIGCYFCHNTVAVDGTHNNPLRLSDDVTMRGRYRDPADTGFHRSEYSELFPGDRVESAALCGSCHDIVLPSPPAPAPVHLERTYHEWLGSVFAPERAPVPSAISTCTACHMPAVESGAPIATSGPDRVRHSHSMAGVDGPLTPFPDTGNPARDAELAEAQRRDREQLLDHTVRVDICLQVLSETESAVHVTLDNANAGHNFPSGAAQDRRAYIELVAYAGDAIVYQSGVVPDGQAVSRESDPDLWLLRDEVFDADGNEAHMFWNVARSVPKTLPVQTTLDPADEAYYRQHLRRRFPLDASTAIAGVPDRVTVRIRLVPVGFDVLDDLIASGHLDPAVRDEMETLDLVPYRHDDFRSDPDLAGLNTVTMEWSAASRASPLFVAREDFTQRPPWSCVGMPTGRR